MEPLKSFTLKNFTFDHDALLFQAMNFISVGCKISLFILREDETPIYQSPRRTLHSVSKFSYFLKFT